ncbi:hypothetical protein D9758_005330 [Tetrapyrgos nigripes]|uniref:Uncharacterized protein n=1 Tax=Tetrapyrgos nigripes TaxID=182062 RepID=A0A8H5LPL6_9AGAR|nr:hypothetical protein D9758_005330 [Tetrapyrgos nigripes]
MKFSIALTAVSFAAFASAAPAGGPGLENFYCNQARDARGTRNGVFNQGCLELVDDCLNTLNTTHSADIWGVKHCVGAAFCDGTENLLHLAKCQNQAIDSTDGTSPSLNYNIWAGIVGDCAWNPEGSCPMTRQNFIDFVYGSFSDINIAPDAYPDSSLVIKNWWDPLKEWTATGNTIPYLNLNDWLHYSQS